MLAAIVCVKGMTTAEKSSARSRMTSGIQAQALEVQVPLVLRNFSLVCTFCCKLCIGLHFVHRPSLSKSTTSLWSGTCNTPSDDFRPQTYGVTISKGGVNE
jgi:hypothetical protein